MKEMICTILIMFLFIWINITYLQEFKETKFDTASYNIKFLKTGMNDAYWKKV